MKKFLTVTTTLALSAVYIPAAHAETCPHGGSPNWQGVCDTTTDSGESYFGETIEEVSSEDSIEISDNTPETEQETPEFPIDQDEPEIWAIVDDNGNTTNITVCDVDYCGSGRMPVEFDGNTPTAWVDVVLQSSRDPESGAFGGGHWGQYDDSTGKWTQVAEDGKTYEMPTEYDADPICIKNCSTENENIQGSGTFVAYQDDTILVQDRSAPSDLRIASKKIYFSNKVHNKNKIKFGKVWLIAKNNDDKKIWKFKVGKRGRVQITIPIEYINWNISINYKLKNNKKISKSIMLKN